MVEVMMVPIMPSPKLISKRLNNQLPKKDPIIPSMRLKIHPKPDPLTSQPAKKPATIPTKIVIRMSIIIILKKNGDLN